jgi:hypothetical protein
MPFHCCSNLTYVIFWSNPIYFVFPDADELDNLPPGLYNALYSVRFLQIN